MDELKEVILKYVNAAIGVGSPLSTFLWKNGGFD